MPKQMALLGVPTTRKLAKEEEKDVIRPTLTTLTSVAGGILGYLIGLFTFELVAPLVDGGRYTEPFELAKSWFARPAATSGER